ncbi:Glycosyltransferase involved in cell wall bisynthesis [Fibrobacter sp. UWT3]|uniref:glycosyltransferase family 4 protein n=1 Tax=Fibrobacter sp. UWT3 TaxID=1896225 RepID=UPI000BD7EEFB|nr:glycosyltransferase family 1 protein [Fibrobacter sp. UWT3]SOE51382.1 Glycosyltransferase involved in cell wall bisynthesis [Fibrobacter sp. UWT3]
MAKIIINGKFFSQRITGVQRYAREMLNALDPMLMCGDVLLVLPKDAHDVPCFQNIKIHRTNIKASIIFDQIYMPFFALKMGLPALHMCHVAPILKPDYVFIYDANVEKNPKWFTKKIFIWYYIIHWICSKWSKKIFTDSDFAKNELCNFFGVAKHRIVNVGAGWQHMLQIQDDENTLLKFGLEKGNYFFSLGTKAPHKNLKWVYEYASKHPKDIFAVSGSSDGKIFGKVDAPLPSNVRFLGYLSDSEIKFLMKNSKAFLFPSFYEGFGIPPLEALSTGCRVIVSDIPVMHENFGKTVWYINPHCVDVDLDVAMNTPIESADVVLEKYSWRKGAEILREILIEK